MLVSHQLSPAILFPTVDTGSMLQQIYSLIFRALHKNRAAFTDCLTRIQLILRTVFTVVMVTLLMLLGCLHSRRVRVTQSQNIHTKITELQENCLVKFSERNLVCQVQCLRWKLKQCTDDHHRKRICIWICSTSSVRMFVSI